MKGLRRRRWPLVCLAGWAAALSVPAVAQEPETARILRRSKDSTVSIQGTWVLQAKEEKLAGTWHMEITVSKHLDPTRALSEGRRRDFSGEVSLGGTSMPGREVYGTFGADRIEFTSPGDPAAKNLGGESLSGEGVVDQDRVRGTFKTSSGAAGEWSGWWVVKADGSR